MEHELSLVCSACGRQTSQGGFSEPQILTNDAVLAQMEHNPGCPVPNAAQEHITITSADIVRRYTISIISETE